MRKRFVSAPLAMLLYPIGALTNPFPIASGSSVCLQESSCSTVEGAAGQGGREREAVVGGTEGAARKA
jgi:hypothetical protein